MKLLFKDAASSIRDQVLQVLLDYLKACKMAPLNIVGEALLSSSQTANSLKFVDSSMLKFQNSFFVRTVVDILFGICDVFDQEKIMSADLMAKYAVDIKDFWSGVFAYLCEQYVQQIEIDRFLHLLRISAVESKEQQAAQAGLLVAIIRESFSEERWNDFPTVMFLASFSIQIFVNNFSFLPFFVAFV